MLQAMILALVHGLAAFLPVSAFAHRTLLTVLLDWPQPPARLEAAIEVGGLAAVLLSFAADWVQIAAAGLGLRVGRDPELRRLPRLFWMLAAASLPVAITGYWLAGEGGRPLRQPFLLGTMLIVVGLAMGWADGSARRQKTIDHLGFADALFIGLAQALAVLPGASRLALTLTAGMLLNFDRAAAARIGYLLAAPVMAGRAWLAVRKAMAESSPNAGETAALVVAALVCAVAGCISIALFTEYLRQHDLRPFVRYRLGFGIMVIALAVLLR